MGRLRKNAFLVKIAWGLGIGLGAAAIALLLNWYRLVTDWELKTYDLRMQTYEEGRPEPSRVIMFYVDEDSLRYMEGQGLHWPWPRELQAAALDFCRRGGAKAVLFDIFYSEDSVYGVDDDAAFAAGVAAGPPSYFVLFLSRHPGEADPREAAVLAKSAVPLAPPFPAWMPVEQSLASLPIAPLVEAATGFGNAQLAPDEDGVYRRLRLIERLGDAAVPAIPLKVAAEVAKVPSLAWPEQQRFSFGETPIPLDRDGLMLINYYGGTDTFPAYPLGKVLASQAAIAANEAAAAAAPSEGSEGEPAPEAPTAAPDLDPSIVKDKIVIIGVAAPGLYDLKPTPLARVFPGPEVHATVLENLLAGDFIRPLSMPATVAIIAAAGLVAAVGLATISSMAGMGAWILAIFAILIGAGFALFQHGVWMRLVAPAAAAALASFGMFVRHYLTEGRKKREIRRAFGQYLSPHVVGQIARDPERLRLGGALQEVTLFFSDIAGFTSISEKMPPEELVAKLNEYFSATTRIIQERDGTLDKYIGDAIMAFWGAPVPVENHGARAIDAALAIQRALAGSAFATRIGIHTGIALVGNIGSDIRFNYTAIGDTVNLASRLEGLNKQFGTSIIASETAMLAAGGAVEARRIGRVRVKGRSEPIGIFEPLGMHGDFGPRGEAACRRFEAALDLFFAGRFGEAREAFAAIAAEADDPTAAIYADVCGRYQQEAPAGFDGVITFTTK